MNNKSFEQLSLEEILLLGNNKLYNSYISELENLSNNRLSKKVIFEMFGNPLFKIYEEITKQEESCRSYEFFQGDLVLLYGGISERKSKDFLTCDFSGGIIYPNSIYIAYRPLFDNISNNEVYVLKKTIKVETNYIYNLPSNIQELEQLQRNIYLKKDLNDGIDYSHFSERMGGEIVFQKLKKRRR